MRADRTRGVKLVVFDTHDALKAAADRVLGATAHRCRVHFLRFTRLHASARRDGDAGGRRRRIVPAWIGASFARNGMASAQQQWRVAADLFRPRLSKLAELMDKGRRQAGRARAWAGKGPRGGVMAGNPEQHPYSI